MRPKVSEALVLRQSVTMNQTIEIQWLQKVVIRNKLYRPSQIPGCPGYYGLTVIRQSVASVGRKQLRRITNNSKQLTNAMMMMCNLCSNSHHSYGSRKPFVPSRHKLDHSLLLRKRLQRPLINLN